MKNLGKALGQLFGVLMICTGLLWTISSAIGSMVFLFSKHPDLTLGRRLASFLLCLIIGAVCVALAYLGNKLRQKCGKEAKDAKAVPTPAAQPVPAKKAPETPADPRLEEIHRLLDTLHEKQQTNAKPSPEALQELAQKLLSLDRLYLAHDVDFNQNFPFVDLGGRMEFFTTEDRAKRACLVAYVNHGMRFTPRAYEKKDYARMLESLRFNGFCYLRVDNGAAPVEMRLEDFPPDDPELPLLDERNKGMRYLLIRNLEYGYRLRKLSPENKSADREKGLQEVMLTMEANGFQALSKSLLYVFGPGPRQKDVTFYTPKALEKAQALLEENGLPQERLLAKGTNSHQVYHGPLQLRVTNRPGKPAMADAMVCAFTESNAANQVLSSFARSGCDDNLLVITWEELMNQAAQCAGVVLDIPTYGMEIPKEEFGKIMQYGAFPGGIVFHIKDGEKDAQTEAEQKPE